MDYNYHTHTNRCRHASGTPEEYIKRAIECGIKHMGFSDHLPYICSNREEAIHRIPVSEADDYISEISNLREKYKDKIDIKVGFEMEYYTGYFEKMLESAIAYGGEYLILGEHFVVEEHPNPAEKHVLRRRNNIGELCLYRECLLSAIKSGVFTYVAHPDIFNFVGDKDIYACEMKKICEAAKEYGVPLEINFLGIREERNYPNKSFWKIAGEVKAPVTFGFDSHDVTNAYDGKSYIKAMEMVEKYNLNYIGKPEIIDIQKLGV